LAKVKLKENQPKTIREVLEAKCHESKENEIKALFGLITKIEDAVKLHLSLIPGQLPNFDLHDISHCYKIIENIEKFLSTEQLHELDPFELFLIYASCLLHDAAMALPKWEYDLLKYCEGQKGFNIHNLSGAFLLDEKPPPSFSSMRELIENIKDILFNFEEAKNFLFCYDEEDFLLSDLTERAIAYLEYRNGFDSLRAMRENDDIDGYKAVSEDIRVCFIRDTHHKRVESYIKALKPEFSKTLGGTWAEGIVDDFCNICRSHGEPFDFVLKLEKKSLYFKYHGANIQFVCTLLRLSDILHFSYDRAPLSLFSEKQIASSESRKHWLTKLQGISYEIKTEDDLHTIFFSAYFKDPDSWYFLFDYIKLIEIEIQNYNKFYRENQNRQYFIKIKDNVNTMGIKNDSDAFIPKDNLCFTLDQSGIINLLMGINLYKDKYLCLRELYQNSLDACRVMRGFYPNKEGNIEFGMGSQNINGKKCKYVYCLDNGSGMDEEIIEHHFLKIGNSYYNSPSFRRLNLKAKEQFQPVSQFGIGVLSCFMIGHTLDITTKSMETKESIRFIVNGLDKHFYYMKPNKQDLDLLEDHGTLVKLFLKSNDRLTDEYPGEKELLEAFYKDRYYINDNGRKYFYLLGILQLYIFNVPEKIKLSVKTKKGLKNLWNVTTLISDIYKFYDDTTIWNIISPQISPSEISKLNDFNLSKIVVEHNGIVYYNYLVLPKIPSGSIEGYFIDLVLRKVLNPYLVLNHGIGVGDASVFWSYLVALNESSVRFSEQRGFCFSFCSDLALELSVNRTAIVSIPDKLIPEIDVLLKKIAKSEVNYIWKYISDTNIKWDSDLSNEIWATYFKLQEWNIENIIDAVLQSEAKVYIKTLCNAISCTQSLNEILRLKFISFRNMHLIRLDPIYSRNDIHHYFLSNLIFQSFEVSTKEEAIEVKLFETGLSLKNASHNKSNPMVIVEIESYTGMFHEYDYVNSFFPFTPKALFNRINISEEDSDNKKILIDNKCRKLLLFGSFMRFFFDNLQLITSKTIYPERLYYYETDVNSQIGRRTGYKFGFILNEHIYLNYGSSNSNENTMLYCFFCPDSLSKEDEKEIKYYESKEPKYVEGIRNGWSVILLGGTDQVIVEPRIVKKSKILKKIEKSFWERNKGKEFYFPDGTHVTEAYIDALKDE
jgi:molecular chaperone HtpG